RFAKVGGEMVSFAAVEALAGDLWPDAISAVVSVPDARKGERLLLYTNKAGANRSDFIAFARARHVSELMIPAEVIVMEKLPMLGSGKVDLLTLAKTAKEERAQAADARPPVPA
ncbi:AMP-binding enzyme, partial [Pseudorhodoplanes sp.]|uniref:AMP-binding enzyme n=1 Tax=Pseudorhodoplanes sp. TaxID=1934341 RepID=UPI00391A5604